uniref:Uncharacterized protein n=1 Tax=Arundo donax TaxID=35708 RepID=A0A0A9CN49_ARUDO
MVAAAMGIPRGRCLVFLAAFGSHLLVLTWLVSFLHIFEALPRYLAVQNAFGRRILIEYPYALVFLSLLLMLWLFHREAVAEAEAEADEMRVEQTMPVRIRSLVLHDAHLHVLRLQHAHLHAHLQHACYSSGIGLRLQKLSNADLEL